MTTPAVGRIVHYVAPGSADGRFPPAHRAAIITDVRVSETHDPAFELRDEVRLAVLNPTGLFFTEWLREDNTGSTPFTWHWPERV